MKYLLFVIPFFLTGCFTTPVPVKQNFPVAPEVLLEKCPNLNKVADKETSITELIKVVVKNYGLYYECANKVDGWSTWYQNQKEIFEKANK